MTDLLKIWKHPGAEECYPLGSHSAARAAGRHPGTVYRHE